MKDRYNFKYVKIQLIYEEDIAIYYEGNHVRDVWCTTFTKQASSDQSVCRTTKLRKLWSLNTTNLIDNHILWK